MFPTTRQERLLVSSINTVLFAALTFLYLYFYQSGLLYAATFLLSNGAIEYSPTFGAIVITALLLLIHIGLTRLYKPVVRLTALTFIPEIIILALLTGFDITSKNTLQYGNALPFCIVAAIFFVGITIFFSSSKRINNYETENQQCIKNIWHNVLLLSFLFISLSCFTNNNKTLHTQIRIEQCFTKDDYSNALTAAKTQTKPNENITMLTMYALSCEGELAEKLFEYPISAGSQYILPQNDGSQTIFFPKERILSCLGMNESSMKSGKDDIMSILERLDKSNSNAVQKDILTDYLLCGYLLDKDLDKFAETFITRSNTTLEVPKHYQEALVLYAHTRSNPQIVFKNNIVETDFQDFQRMEKEISDPTKRRNRLRDVYGNTYWYYFTAR